MVSLLEATMMTVPRKVTFFPKLTSPVMVK